MIILYEHTETSFTSNGLGCLNDALTCNVKEELNGDYELEMQYPVNGIHYSDIVLRRIILTKPNSYDQAQPFRIYSISKPINGIVTINAEHISYDMSGIPVKGAIEHYAWYVNDVFNHIKNNSLFPCPFTFSSDITEEKKEINLSKPRSVRSYLGTEDGLLSLFGGEWEFDRYYATLHKQRGTNRGVFIEYGKNLIDVTQEEKCSDMYTGVYPYYYNEDDGLQCLDDTIIPIIESSYKKVLTLDLTSEFEEMPTQDTLREKATEYIKKNKLDEPKVSLKVSFIKNPEVIESLQDVRLGDTVGVKFVKIGVNTTSRCISYVFNSITGQYNSIELGEPMPTLVDSVTSTNKKLSEEEERAKEAEGILRQNVEVNSTNISLEIERAKTAEGDLSGKINITESNIDLEVKRAMGVEETLRSSISLTADQIIAEVSRAMEAEETLRSSISVNADAITAEVYRATSAEGIISGNLSLKIDKDDDGQIISLINGSANKIHFNATNMFTVDSPNFSIDESGNVKMSGKINVTEGGRIGNFVVSEKGLDWASWAYNPSNKDYTWETYGTKIWANTISTEYVFPSLESGQITLGHGSKNTNIDGNTININGSSVYVNGKEISLDGHTHDISNLNYALTSYGNIIFPGGNLATTSWCSNTFKKKGSDVRLKKNISDLQDISDFYMKLKPKKYEFKDKLRGYDNRVHYGFIAQDIKNISSESSNLVYKKLCDDDLSNEREVIDDDYVYYVDKDELHAMHVQMIQKQHGEIETLKQINSSLEKRISILETKNGGYV